MRQAVRRGWDEDDASCSFAPGWWFKVRMRRDVTAARLAGSGWLVLAG